MLTRLVVKRNAKRAVLEIHFMIAFVNRLKTLATYTFM